MTAAQFLLTYWPIIAYFLGGIVSIAMVWMKMSAKVAQLTTVVNDHKTNLAKIEGRVDSVYPVLVLLQTDMASVKTSLDFIKGTISHLTK